MGIYTLGLKVVLKRLESGSKVVRKWFESGSKAVRKRFESGSKSRCFRRIDLGMKSGYEKGKGRRIPHQGEAGIRSSRISVTSGGESSRIWGPHVPEPRLV